MKLSELTPSSQYDIRSALTHELQEWRFHSWWRKGTAKYDLEMRTWCKAFIRFYLDVRADKDIPESYRTWSGLDINGRTLGNCAQLRIHDLYRRAVREVEISQAAQREIDDLPTGLFGGILPASARDLTPDEQAVLNAIFPDTESS